MPEVGRGRDDSKSDSPLHNLASPPSAIIPIPQIRRDSISSWNSHPSPLILRSTISSTLFNCLSHKLAAYTSIMQARQTRSALKCVAQARRFSTSTSRAAISPYRPAQASPSTPVKDAKRAQSTAAAQPQERPVPAPAFNRDDTRFNDVQPLRPYRQPEMDHSFIGKTGGEIFHEMMLRQGVKHVCML